MSSRPLLVWLRALRPLAHGNIAPPILLGQALALHAGHALSPWAFALAHAFGVLDHAWIVLANDLADHETDRDNTTFGPFSGGSRVVPDGLLSLAALERGAWMAGALLVALTLLAAVALDRALSPLFALAAIALLHAYSFAPLRLSYRGGGELLQGLGVGVVLPLWGFYAQAGSLARVPWSALAPLLALHAIGNVVTALPDAPSDARAPKKTWPVRVGEGRARRHVLVALAVTLGAIGWQAATHLTVAHALAILALPAASLLSALSFVARADASDRPACLRFVLATAGAIGAVQLAWALALFCAERPG